MNFIMSKLASEFMDYLAAYQTGTTNGSFAAPDLSHLPPISELSKQLGLSVAILREQLEAAKAIGLVDVRPRTGIRLLPYSFFPAVRLSLSYAIAIDWNNFLAFSDLRNHIETAYWDEAAPKLTPSDHDSLQQLVQQAWQKLQGRSIQIPHQEHRLLHLIIFSRLDNPFVSGLLEGYWDAYEAVGLNLYADYEYLQQVWRYHQEMVEGICQGDFAKGYQALVLHRDLLSHRTRLPIRQQSRSSDNRT